MTKPCEKCGHPASPVYRATSGMTLRGWYCVACQYFDKAIGRERQFTWEAQS